MGHRSDGLAGGGQRREIPQISKLQRFQSILAVDLFPFPFLSVLFLIYTLLSAKAFFFSWCVKGTTLGFEWSLYSVLGVFSTWTAVLVLVLVLVWGRFLVVVNKQAIS